MSLLDDRLAARLREGRGTLAGLWGSARALAAARAVRRESLPVLIAVPGAEEALAFETDLKFFGIERTLLFAPTPPLPGEASLPDPESLRALAQIAAESTADLRSRARGRARCRVSPGPPRAAKSRISPLAVVVPAYSLCVPLPPAGWPEGASREVFRGERLRPQELADRLAAGGYEPAPAVEGPGEFLLRGGILDLFPITAQSPVRIEFDEERVETLRTFDPATQRSTRELRTVSIASVPKSDESAAGLLDHFPAGSLAILVEGAGRDRILGEASARRTLVLQALPAASGGEAENFAVEALPHFGADPDERFRALAGLRDRGLRVILPAPLAEERSRLAELAGAAGAEVVEGEICEGFAWPDEGAAWIAPHEFLARPPRRRFRAAPPEGRPLDTFLDLARGDLIVHAAHGIGRFVGQEVVVKGGRPQEFLVVEYSGGRRLFVPVTRLDLCERYVGGPGKAPRLDRIGGRAFARRRMEAERAVFDLAGELLEIQAAREARPGFAFPAEGREQAEFEASFPFEDTPDQARACAEIKRDMEAARPMDRLVCGDVGFGKTELAVRAAFKAAMAGRQAAVLVPTTILAEQHLQTFGERMRPFAVRVEALSRFRSAEEEAAILEGITDGRVDVVIGTHRLLSADIGFRDLGLVIVDEEQRFGVAHKEALKRLRASVDVLTMTATPIPRTLHLSILGIKQVSTLKTPPPDRLAVETHVVPFDPGLIQGAILRERARGGQTFFVHNRVHDIEAVAEGLARIVPEVRMGIAHGQMESRLLEARMVAFLRREFDLLLTTTIIASGVDLPNVNTIFIHAADRFGLADLHQLRGRVGRSARRAYAYLLLSPETPPGSDAAKRLKAIEQYRDLGAGFKIAMKDLEIRGAGNILGAAQHGHIAAVGYEMYCRLLERAVRRARGESVPERFPCTVDLNVSAWLPPEYVAAGEERMNLYKRLTRAEGPEEVLAIGEELRDRFGPPPPPAVNLLRVTALRAALERARVRHAGFGEGYLRFECRDEDRFRKAVGRKASRLRRVRTGMFFVEVRREEPANEEVLEEALALMGLSKRSGTTPS